MNEITTKKRGRGMSNGFFLCVVCLFVFFVCFFLVSFIKYSPSIIFNVPLLERRTGAPPAIGQSTRVRCRFYRVLILSSFLSLKILETR